MFLLCQAIGNRGNLNFPRNTSFPAFRPPSPVLRASLAVSRLASAGLGWRRLTPLFSLYQRLESHTYPGKPVQEVLNTHQKDLPAINPDHNCIKESPPPSLLPNSARSQEMHASFKPRTAVLHLLINVLRALILIHSLPYFFPPEECIFQSVRTVVF